MAEFPALPIWTDAFLADCGHLQPAEFGLYVRLLMLMWRTPGCRVPNDDEWLQEWMQVHEPGMCTLLRKVISTYCSTDGNWITQKRLQREFEYVKTTSKRRSDAAKSRWKKDIVPSNSNAQAASAEDMQTSIRPAMHPHPHPHPHHSSTAAATNGSKKPNGTTVGDHPAGLLVLCNELGIDLTADTRRIGWPGQYRALVEEGFDLHRHLIPAARAAKARGTTIKSLVYLRPQALEIKAAEEEPVEIDEVDERGWARRLKIFAEGMPACEDPVTSEPVPATAPGWWSRRWGPKRGEPGHLCPDAWWDAYYRPQAAQ